MSIYVFVYLMHHMRDPQTCYDKNFRIKGYGHGNSTDSYVPPAGAAPANAAAPAPASE